MRLGFNNDSWEPCKHSRKSTWLHHRRVRQAVYQSGTHFNKSMVQELADILCKTSRFREPQRKQRLLLLSADRSFNEIDDFADQELRKKTDYRA